MSTQDNSIGQKVRCANHRSVIECDGWVGTREGSKYCADCRTTIDFVCAGCGEMRSMPRGLYQILTAQGKKTKCFDCLHGSGGKAEPTAAHEPKPAAERKQNPERKQGKVHDNRVRLHSQLHDGSLDPIITGAIPWNLAEHIQQAFPGTMFARASGHLLPAYGLGVTYPDENRPRVRRPKRVWKRPSHMKYLDPNDIKTGAVMSANLYKMSGGKSERKKDPFYYAVREINLTLKNLERTTNRKVILGEARAFLTKASYNGYPTKTRWGYVEDAVETANRFLRRLSVDGALQQRCGLA